MHGASDKAGKAVDVPPPDWEQRFEVFRIRIGWLRFLGEFLQVERRPEDLESSLVGILFFFRFHLMADLFGWRGKVLSHP